MCKVIDIYLLKCKIAQDNHQCSREITAYLVQERHQCSRQKWIRVFCETDDKYIQFHLCIDDKRLNSIMAYRRNQQEKYDTLLPHYSLW